MSHNLRSNNVDTDQTASGSAMFCARDPVPIRRYYRIQMPASVAQFDECPTGDPEDGGSTPSRSATFFRGN